MFKKIICTLVIMLACISVQAQRGNIWCFGDSAAIDFTNLSNPIATTSSVGSRGSCASIADSNGGLLFYAHTRSGVANNSGLVYNNLHSLMQNGDSLLGQGWYQELTIIPSPDDDSILYIFSVGVTNSSFPGLFYSIVDLRGDSGLGAVTQKNVQLLNFLMVDCILAVKHGNGRDWWLMVRPSPGSFPNTNNSWCIFLISTLGITPMPIQNVGEMNGTSGGTLSISSDGSKICFVNWGGIIELLNFNRCSGILSPSVTIEPQLTASPYPYYWSSEFSPDGRFLYVTSTTNPISRLWQYDTWAPNIFASKTLIWQTSLPPYTAGALKRGPDDKIYLSCGWVQSNGWYYFPYDSIHYYPENMNLSVIHSPNSAGLSCDFQPWSFYLGGKRTYWGLPNNPDYDLGPLVGSACDTLVGISESQPILLNPHLNVFYHPEWQTTFINADKLTGTKGTMEIFDVQGKIVHREDIQIVNGYYTRNFNMTGMANGMYFVNLITSGQRLSGKLVKY